MSRRQTIASLAAGLFLLGLIAALFELQQRERRGRLALVSELAELRQSLAAAEGEAARRARQSRDESSALVRALAEAEQRLAAAAAEAQRRDAARRERAAAEREARAQSEAAAARRRERTIAELSRGLDQMESAGAFQEQSLAALRRAPRERAARLRGLLPSAVRVNARKEVGSGVVIFSGRRQEGRPLETFILTAYHVIKDDFASEGAKKPRSIEVDFFAEGRQKRRALASIVAVEVPWDLALLKISGEVLAKPARLATPNEAAEAGVLAPVLALGCPLGYPPMPSRGSVASVGKDFDGRPFWMITAPTIFGNSGGGVFDGESGRLLGLLVRIAAYKNVIDVAVPHLGIVTPASAIRAWLCERGYSAILEPGAGKETLAAGRRRD